uniref:Major facilitator superfamily (MFS) profile domain-containing protein n=1 Tax=Palpitomonas bilix TaxID=652834 RepID=A0A7S3LVX0_9EUKA|mmetsp:Transcript_50281/g.129439  ORF Transcript_50281/g.129439 Transcript_50281/m.129439 type:complete len:449 (+) Transcript_50281:228-1574(+)|eukprot:CAMPEP_0113888014 /NCGR_PEP_ID=MMETSP0780_2-20120614/12590_1 /TAXON_ID=652834 /ORGANISM="Palpitomonas bilix" /LENGTH=448 /DNA_ID=CAMNT_0000876723 /DNA_START=97 /DNA_END=1443 /DNA_ORIENTATION=+ /assembly_acc=CAM_ASM_000599
MGLGNIGMKPLLLSFILPSMAKDWPETSSIERGLVASSLFLGMLIGSFIFGTVADKIGRKSTLAITSIFAIGFTVAASFSPTPWVLMLFEMGLGFGVGGNLPVCYTLFVEFIPQKRRGFYLALLATAWSAGEVIAAAIAWGVMAEHGWRRLLQISTIPTGAILFVLPFIPESPRFLLMRMKGRRAFSILQKIGNRNRRPIPSHIEGLIPYHSTTSSGVSSRKRELLAPLKRLFNKQNRKQTVILWLMWLCASCGLLGVIIFLPDYFHAKGIGNMSIYEDIFLSTTGNVPGIIVAAFLIETRLGRKKTMAILSFLCAAFIFVLGPVSSATYLIVASAISKFFLYGLWAAIDAYTPESYSTQERSTGSAAANCWARIAGLASPPIFSALLEAQMSIWVPIGIWVALFIATGVLALLLPRETMGRDIDEVDEDNVALGSIEMMGDEEMDRQ